MEMKNARLFQSEVDGIGHAGGNIVEREVLESRRELRQKINELIGLCNASSLTTSDMQQQLLLGVATYGKPFATQLVRSLHSDDTHKRQQIVWLLTLLKDDETIPLLQLMSHNERLPRTVRLSAALALAGMGVTAEVMEQQDKVRLYAIS